MKTWFGIDKIDQKSRALFLAVLFLGIFIRVLVSFRGFNYDFVSFWSVSGIASDFKNVYTETTRYNYGPIWFCLLFIFRRIANFFPGLQVTIFRGLLILFLILADFVIFIVLLKKKGLLVGGLYYLNPIVMIITGYHNQFENIAIAIALAACFFLECEDGSLIVFIKGLLLLGLSITIKHLFVFFPIWLFFRYIFQRQWKKGFLSLILPLGVFIVSFIPFLRNGGLQGIIQNVFLYRSFPNAPFYTLFIPKFIQIFSTPLFWWVIAMLTIGLTCRNRELITLEAIYLMALVTFSPAMANQYLILPVIFISLFPNPFFILYILIGTFQLFVNIDGLQLSFFQSLYQPPYHLLFYICNACLVAGLIMDSILEWNRASRRVKSLPSA